MRWDSKHVMIYCWKNNLGKNDRWFKLCQEDDFHQPRPAGDPDCKWPTDYCPGERFLWNNLFKLMLILPDDGSGGSTSAATGKLRYVTAPGENWEEILLRNILDFKQHANTFTSETHHLLDLFTFVITDIYLRSIGLCKPLSTRLCFSIFIS